MVSFILSLKLLKRIFNGGNKINFFCKMSVVGTVTTVILCVLFCHYCVIYIFHIKLIVIIVNVVQCYIISAVDKVLYKSEHGCPLYITLSNITEKTWPPTLPLLLAYLPSLSVYLQTNEQKSSFF